MDKPENPPAFPLPDAAAYQYGGMTLRDWFAGQAMNEAISRIYADQSGGYAEAASYAYEFADAMLAERGKG